MAVAVAPAGADKSPTGRSLALRDALTGALAQNPDILVAAIDVDIASARALAARGVAQDVVVDATLSGSANRSRAVAGINGQELERDVAAISAGITKPLITGGSVAVRVDGPFIRLRTQVIGRTGETFEADARTYTSRARLELTQPLLRGAGSDSSRAAVRSARAGVASARASHEATATQIARSVLVAYWELTYAADEIAIRRESAALAREHRRIVRVQIKRGDRAEIDIAEVDMEVALRDEELAIAETNLVDRSLELARLMGDELAATAAPLVPADDIVLDIAVPARTAAIAAATERNPQLRAFRANQRARAIEVAAAEDQTSPALDFRAAVETFGRKARAGDAARDMFGSDNVGVEASVVLTIPIGRREARGQLAEARASRARVRVQHDAARRQIQVDTARAYNRVVLAQKRMDVLATAVANAARAAKLDKRRYRLGAVTTYDVLRRQQEVAEATLRQRRARADHAIAMADLFALTGGLLELLDIQLQ